MSVGIIGINGFKRSGKGETAAAILSLCQDNAVHGVETGFAHKVKVLGARALGFVDLSEEECVDLMNEAKEEWLFNIFREFREPLPGLRQGDVVWHDLTGREYLQHIGTEARKIFGADFWVDQVLPKPGGPFEIGRIRLGADPKPYMQSLSDRRLDERYPGVDWLAISDLRFENEAQRVLELGGEVWEVIRPGTESDGHDSEQVLPRELVTRQIINDGNLMDLRFEVEKALGL